MDGGLVKVRDKSSFYSADQDTNSFLVFDFGSLSGSYTGMGVASGRTRMIFAGRYSGTTEYNAISFITIASQGDATDFGDLTTVRGRGTGGASSTRALFAGNGKDPATVTNTIDFVTIAATGNAVDFGDLTVARGTGALSNGHGGLG